MVILNEILTIAKFTEAEICQTILEEIQDNENDNDGVKLYINAIHIYRQDRQILY